ncbi:MAG: hypothetical protein Q8R18_00195 [bacterium]|nr:hypothetical protein [bacterium]
MKNKQSSVSSNKYLWMSPRLDTRFIAELFSEQLMQLPLERRK